jgi:hypothetical protein
MSAALVVMITDGQDTQKRARATPTSRLCDRPGAAPSTDPGGHGGGLRMAARQVAVRGTGRYAARKAGRRDVAGAASGGGTAVGALWDAAVAVAGEEPPADLSAAVAEELIALWSDLSQALGRAGGRRWSVECDGLVVRIVMLSRLTNATPWQHVPASLLAEGIYQRILRSAGVTFAPPGTAGTGRARRPAQPKAVASLIEQAAD